MSKPGAFWQATARLPTLEEFAAAFTPDATFETSSCNEVVRGAADIRQLLLAMSSLYDSLAFTRETSDGRTTFLEWQGAAFGEHVAGVTVISRDDQGLILSVHLYQRPLKAVVRFARHLDAKLQTRGPRGRFCIEDG